MNNMSLKRVILIAVAGVFLPELAFATLDTAKLYKSAFGTDEKPKCITCHVSKLPKKEDGKHDLNDYGTKLKDAKDPAKETIDEATLKKVGPNDKAEF